MKYVLQALLAKEISLSTCNNIRMDSVILLSELYLTKYLGLLLNEIHSYTNRQLHKGMNHIRTFPFTHTYHSNTCLTYTLFYTHTAAKYTQTQIKTHHTYTPFTHVYTLYTRTKLRSTKGAHVHQFNPRRYASQVV